MCFPHGFKPKLGFKQKLIVILGFCVLCLRIVKIAYNKTMNNEGRLYIRISIENRRDLTNKDNFSYCVTLYQRCPTLFLRSPHSRPQIF